MKQIVPRSITGVADAPAASVLDHEFGASEPYTLGVGPAGDYVRSIDDATRDRVIAACRTRVPDGEFTLDATAWAARGRVRS